MCGRTRTGFGWCTGPPAREGAAGRLPSALSSCPGPPGHLLNGQAQKIDCLRLQSFTLKTRFSRTFAAHQFCGSKGASSGSLRFSCLFFLFLPIAQFSTTRKHQPSKTRFLSRDNGSSLLLQDRQGPPSSLRGCPTVSIHRPMSKS